MGEVFKSITSKLDELLKRFFSGVELSCTGWVACKVSEWWSPRKQAWNEGGHQCLDLLLQVKPEELRQNALHLNTVVTETLRQNSVVMHLRRARERERRKAVCLLVNLCASSFPENSSSRVFLLYSSSADASFTPPPPPHSPASLGSLPTLSHWAIPHIFHSVTHSGPRPALTHAALDSWTEIRDLSRWTPVTLELPLLHEPGSSSFIIHLYKWQNLSNFPWAPLSLLTHTAAFSI